MYSGDHAHAPRRYPCPDAVSVRLLRSTASDRIMSAMKHLFGPVASRRLGRSLGVDVIPFKTCSLDCIYCECGHTTRCVAARAEYVPTQDISAELTAWLDAGNAADVITFAGSGEPTLHSGLGALIRLIKQRTTIPVCVLTNGTMLWRDDVRGDLLPADIVVPTLSAPTRELFQQLHRPCQQLRYEEYRAGLRDFAREYRGQLWLEVFLVPGINDDDATVRALAAQAAELRPAKVQLNTAVRPAADADVAPLTNAALRRLAAFFTPPAEVVGAQPDGVAEHTTVDDAVVLAMLRRRPCTLADLAAGLGMSSSAAAYRIHVLEKSGVITVTERGGEAYYSAAPEA